MFKHKWSAIIYGRSYHVDFRFITIPQDFSDREKDWAAEYILATFSQANKLSANPRWSLFKNESHCVVGVTCMVRDLLQNMDREIIELLSKDNRGRPLYAFVGYVTQLDRRKRLLDFPPYTHQDLQSFQDLHQYILKVWQVEEYYKDSKKPIFNEYQALDFHNQEVKVYDTLKLAKQINHQEKYPQQTYLWHNTLQQKRNLWVASAICHQPISVYLGDRNLKYISDSPFLNQTVITNSSHQIEDCVIKKIERKQLRLEPEKVLPDRQNKKLSQAIKTKLKSDLKATADKVKVVKNNSKNLLGKLNNNHLNCSSNSQPVTNNKNSYKESNFGFKAKSKPHKNCDREWF